MSLKARAVNVAERGVGTRHLGVIVGDVFHAERDIHKHLWRGGKATAEDAIDALTAAWGLDLEVMEDLATTHHVTLVEVTTKTDRYRVQMSELLGPKSFPVTFGSHRMQVLLPLHLWTKTPR